MILNVIGLVLSSITAIISFYNFFRALERRFNKNDISDIDGEIISCVREESRPDGITREYTYNFTVRSESGQIHHVFVKKRRTAAYICRKNNISIIVPNTPDLNESDMALLGALSGMRESRDDKIISEERGTLSEIIVWLIVGMLFLAGSIFCIFAFFIEGLTFGELLLRLIYGE